MKKRIFIALSIVLAVLSSCGKQTKQIDYLPCVVERGDDWGFVNSKGEVFCEDEFSNRPTEVRDGVFFLKEDGAYAMYQFDKKRPKLILDEIKEHGMVMEGLVPICKKDSHIEIINTNGKTKFVLDKVGGKKVLSCGPYFDENGYLVVTVLDNEGKKKSGIIDKSGDVVLQPQYKYNSITILGKNLFIVGKEDKELFVNRDGEEQEFLDEDLDITMLTKEYVAGELKDRCYIYNMKGEEILKCPSKVKRVEAIEGDLFVYKNSDYEKGVMNLKGEEILRAKYDEIAIYENGFLVRRDSRDDLEFLDKNGEKVLTLDDYDYVAYWGEFGNIGIADDEWCILDDDFKQLNKIEIYEIGLLEYTYEIESDFFDYEAVINDVEEALKGEIEALNFGDKVTNISSVTKKGTDAFSRYTETATLKIAEGNKYSILAELYFDDEILSPIYKEKKVERYSWYYGTYYDTERVIDGYKFNNEAQLERIEVEINVPYEKQEIFKEKLTEFLKNFTSKDEEGVLFKNGRAYKLVYNIDIYIEPYYSSVTESVEVVEIDTTTSLNSLSDVDFF